MPKRVYHERIICSDKLPFIRKLCHQRPDRSFYLFGRKMLVCSRCFGIYLLFFSTLAFLSIFPLKNNIKFITAILAFIISASILFIDGYTQLRQSRTSNNSLRFITGGFFGMTAAIIIIKVIWLIF
ncbi:MAG: DUF2085 domain-containing protein [Nanoarchaeota archaeon]|jgi:uncharacterized membrane protein|nr:DUF2085 domain-containing protein [Nanoarchaeota archaeon]